MKTQQPDNQKSGSACSLAHLSSIKSMNNSICSQFHCRRRRASLESDASAVTRGLGGRSLELQPRPSPDFVPQVFKWAKTLAASDWLAGPRPWKRLHPLLEATNIFQIAERTTAGAAVTLAAVLPQRL